MSKYICEINRDESNNELELVHAHKYNAIISNNGGIKFPDKKSMNKYFKDRCVSVESLKSNGNNIFTFLFWILLFIFIVTLLLQLFSKNDLSVPISTGKANLSAFGKFNF
jgi:ATP-dependent Zn protease